MWKYIKSAALFACVLFYFSAAHAQQLADKVIGIVDNKIILLSDIEGQYMQMAQQQKSLPPVSIKCDILDQALTQKLLITQAAIDSVTVTDDEVDQKLDERIRYFESIVGSEQKLEQYYGKPIAQLKEDFRSQIRDNAIADKEKSNIVQNVTVSPSEVQDYFNRIPKDSLPFFNTTVDIGEIVIYPQVSPEAKQIALDRINTLRDRIAKGEDFSKLAILYSQDPGSASNGGDLGFVDRGELDPAFEAAAFNLKNPGDISQVVESKYGYHIIQLIERRGDRIDVRHILVIPQTTNYDLTAAYKKIDSVRSEIMASKISFEQAVNQYSENDETKNAGGMLQNPTTGGTSFQMNDLGQFDQSLVFTIDSLEKGQISEPLLFKDRQQKTAYRLVWLKDETQPHRANLKDDYTAMQQSALTQKQVKILNDWIADRISKTYISVDSDYQSCKSLSRWFTNKQSSR